jgi:hypothetical protein
MSPDYLNALIGPAGILTTAFVEGEEVVLKVAGVCMEPALRHQSLVRLERPRFFIPGDVVAFYCPNMRRLICHRFLGYVWRRGAWKLMTMPDRGGRPDPLVDESAALGRVIALGERLYQIPLFDRLKAIYRYMQGCARLAVLKDLIRFFLKIR